MKEIERLIEAREAIDPPCNNQTRIYGYIRPHKNGEATVEFWGTRFHSHRKGSPRVCKRFFAFRTDSDIYSTWDTLQYNSYSPLCHDHICYSFPEAGGTNYHKHYDPNLLGVKLRDRISKTAKGHLPRYIPILNSWEGTKYRYCGYDMRSGFFFSDYLALWRKHPKAEILSKMGCYQLLTDKFLTALEDKSLAKYVYHNRDAIQRHSVMPKFIMQAHKRNIDITQRIDELEAQKRRHAEQRRIRANRQAIEDRERERKRLAENDNRIFALYEQLKSICTTYGAFEVIVPKNSQEMLDEGEAMHNCIGKCYASHQGKTDICLFLHRNGKPCVDIRIDLETFELMECRAVCNKNADETAWATAHQITEQVKYLLAA